MKFQVVCEKFNWSEEYDTFFEKKSYAEEQAGELNAAAWGTYPRGDEPFWVEEVVLEVVK